VARARSKARTKARPSGRRRWKTRRKRRMMHMQEFNRNKTLTSSVSKQARGSIKSWIVRECLKVKILLMKIHLKVLQVRDDLNFKAKISLAT
jgi:hypothetical protein